ncbi:TatD family hydrolase [uncultured Shewanella sp.]|uniref:TatD family hydrolase n=1 Tax=Shewanella atlantica TaxID=271099 RepID=UPI0026335082|nr:TatD family hydrolase [uncultured Shewanella sp.]
MTSSAQTDGVEPTGLKIIDSHAHLDFPEFDSDRAELFDAMKRAGIESAIIPGVSPELWDRQIAVAKQFNCPYALGIHPWYCQSDSLTVFEALKSRVETVRDDKNLVAIGECGLDKIRKTNWQIQLTQFERQLQLAKELELPIILHVVKAHNEMLTLLKQYALPRGGVIHGFYGGAELANEYIRLGYKLGIGGLILNDRARKLKNCIASISLDSFLIETDSPSMAPENAIETRNTPLVLHSIVEEIANLKKKSNVLISEHAFLNTLQLFDL